MKRRDINRISKYVEEGKDTGFVHIHTSLHDTLVNVKTGERTVIHEGIPNLIVIGFGYLVASLLKGGTDNSLPLSYWAVGIGEGSSWDDKTQEERQALSSFPLKTLYNETFRVHTTNVFIDDTDDVITTPGPLDYPNRLEIQAVFGSNVTGSLREFGLFGGAATEERNSGLMIDHKSHAVIIINQTIGLENVLIRR